MSPFLFQKEKKERKIKCKNLCLFDISSGLIESGVDAKADSEIRAVKEIRDVEVLRKHIYQVLTNPSLPIWLLGFR